MIVSSPRKHAPTPSTPCPMTFTIAQRARVRVLSRISRSLTAAPANARWRLVLVCSCLLGLNCLLFAPSFAFSQPPARALAILSPQDLENLYRVCLGLVVRRANMDVFRVSFDFMLMLMAVSWAANSRYATLVRRVCVCAYLVLLLFLGYHHAVKYFYARAPALGEDWRLALNLAYFLAAMVSPRTLVLSVLSVLAAVGVVYSAASSLRAVQQYAPAWGRKRMALACGVLLCAAAGSFTWFGVDDDRPIIRWNGKHVVDNWVASVAEAERMAPLRTGATDRRYEALSRIQLRTRPDVYFLMIEAYGEILATWDMTESYRALLTRAQQRLEAAGFHMRSAYSAAPVYGGTSWFSISTVLSGIMIDGPEAYAALELAGPRLPSLTRFFRTQGYRTYSIQPGSSHRAGLSCVDLFGHDVVVDADRLDYRGPQYGWGHIPDQYALGLFRERFLPHAPEPRYVFFMSVSTHYPWGESVPRYVSDWKTLNHQPPPAADHDASWPALPHTEAIGSALRQSYLRSVEYEWRTLIDLLTHDPSQELVAIVLGDHQPRLESNPPGDVTMNTPIHVLSRDRAFVDGFAEHGFEPGLFATPGAHSVLQHEGLFSLLVSKLEATYGASGPRVAQYYPNGISLSGLNR